LNWDDYKTLCDRPDVWSRWMLEQSAALLEAAGEAALARSLAASLDTTPLDKPDGHTGGAMTDMFVLRIDPTEADRIAAVVADAAARGLHSPATRMRGLGGFAEAWDEYRRWRASQQRDRPA
jgi:hypothetical protein